MSTRERVTILGSTGSIGLSTLDVLGRQRQRFAIHALTAHTNVEGLLQQCLSYRPEKAVMVDETAAQKLREALRARSCQTEVLQGVQALATVAADADTDTVMAAIVGAAGLLPTLAAARAGKKLLLANKEALVMAGPLLMDAVRVGGAVLLPVDSEHNAVFQCLPKGYRCGQNVEAQGVQHIWLTASGGPFRDRPLAEFHSITPDEACAHPNWAMGRKISVDSATMMNKGLEVIEAHWLFALAPDRIRVVIHPQSVVHSLAAYADGSVLAQLGRPDMRTPIAHCLAWPERFASGVDTLDLLATGQLEFRPPAADRFPCLGLAYEALAAGGDASVVLNAANEIAVSAFLQGSIGFAEIARLNAEVLRSSSVGAADSLESILQADHGAREEARAWIKDRCGSRSPTASGGGAWVS
jgi:1-deoxy-D-xylulose-5-phosphate reductoisomerase